MQKVIIIIIRKYCVYSEWRLNQSKSKECGKVVQRHECIRRSESQPIRCKRSGFCSEIAKVEQCAWEHTATQRKLMVQVVSRDRLQCLGWVLSDGATWRWHNIVWRRVVCWEPIIAHLYQNCHVDTHLQRTAHPELHGCWAYEEVCRFERVTTCPH